PLECRQRRNSMVGLLLKGSAKSSNGHVPARRPSDRAMPGWRGTCLRYGRAGRFRLNDSGAKSTEKKRGMNSLCLNSVRSAPLWRFLQIEQSLAEDAAVLLVSDLGETAGGVARAREAETTGVLDRDDDGRFRFQEIAFVASTTPSTCRAILAHLMSMDT